MIIHILNYQLSACLLYTSVVDGFSGTFIINPEEDVLEKAVQKKMEYEKERTALQELKGKDNVTTDGRRINLYANIGNVSDVDKVLDSDAGGIGLFRSEFIYLGREDYPTEEEQFVIYKEVLSRMQDVYKRQVTDSLLPKYPGILSGEIMKQVCLQEGN